MIQTKIVDLVAKVLKVDKSKVEVLDRFLGGMSNYTYHVMVYNRQLTARIIGEGGEYLVNRDAEFNHVMIAQKLRLTAKMIYFDKANGDKISNFIDGYVLSQQCSNNDISLVAKSLKKLHQAPIKKAFDYGLIKRLNDYEKLVKTPLSSTYFSLKDAWIKLYNDEYIKHHKAFCHGDAQRSNIVVKGQKAYLLDFEFSGLNDPFYDIASFGNIDFSDAVKLLEIYLNDIPTSEQINRLKFNRLYQVLQWHVVATYKDELKLSEKLKIPFDLVAKKYLEFAKELHDQITSKDCIDEN